MNLKTLAELCGTSTATVSKAFSGSRDISDATREHIFDVAKEHGCFDKYNKNKFHKYVVAIICPEIISDFYASLVSKLIKELDANGALAIISQTDFKSERTHELYAFYSSYAKVDGVILFDSLSEDSIEINVPTVTMLSSKDTSFGLDMAPGVFAAAERLKELGHTKIAFAGETLTKSRLSHFKSAMRASGITLNDEYISVSESRFEAAGEEAAEKLIACAEPPTAIIAAYDYIAIGLIKKLMSKGYSVPEDFSIVGIDNITLAPYLETSLSTIGFDKDEVCHVVVRTLMAKIKNKYRDTLTRPIIKSRFIERDSVSAPRKK